MKKIVKFEKVNCSPCNAVSAYLEDRKVKYERIDAYDNPERAMKHGLRSVPVVILFDDDKEIARTVGYKPNELDKIIEEFRK